jgi:GTPases - Sulfate adenylate transferase subunit 1
VKFGDCVIVLLSCRITIVTRIVIYDGDLVEVTLLLSIILMFVDEVDCARGDVIVYVGSELHVG